LLKKINAIPGHFWISFISNHPKDVTDEMIETVAKLPKVCECFHLPVQSGNDEIIRKMNRRYTSKQYLNLINKIKSAYKKYKPGKLFSITSDIIVGFPGETKKQFLDSANIMKKAEYDMVYFGQYSPRPGTTAWKFKDNVSKKEKVRREKYLNDILKKNVYANNKKYVGKTLEVLIGSRKGDFYFGKTRTMKNVKFSSVKKGLTGQFVKVKITRVNIWNLEGKTIE
jgi:tRNA-2-methylthio-N6-dimethylallyladenosine synthase